MIHDAQQMIHDAQQILMPSYACTCIVIPSCACICKHACSHLPRACGPARTRTRSQARARLLHTHLGLVVFAVLLALMLMWVVLCIFLLLDWSIDCGDALERAGLGMERGMKEIQGRGDDTVVERSEIDECIHSYSISIAYSRPCTRRTCLRHRQTAETETPTPTAGPDCAQRRSHYSPATPHPQQQLVSQPPT